MPLPCQNGIASRALLQFSKGIVPARLPELLAGAIASGKRNGDSRPHTPLAQHQKPTPISQRQVVTCTVIHLLHFQREMFFPQCLGKPFPTVIPSSAPTRQRSSRTQPGSSRMQGLSFYPALCTAPGSQAFTHRQAPGVPPGRAGVVQRPGDFKQLSLSQAPLLTLILPVGGERLFVLAAASSIPRS